MKYAKGGRDRLCENMKRTKRKREMLTEEEKTKKEGKRKAKVKSEIK